MAIRADSLKVRLFVAVAVWAVAVIVAAAILLTGLYRQTVERRFERELDLHLYNLIAVTDFNPSGGLRGQPALSDPRFGTFLSGWYWVIERKSEDGNSRTFESQSLAGEDLPVPPATQTPYDADFRRVMRLSDPQDHALLAVQRQVLIDNTLTTFLVTGSLEDVAGDVAEFERVLYLFLALFGAGLLFGTIGVVWLGLRPLGAISRALGDIRDGRADRLEGEFPSEIRPLAQEVNALIGANRDVVERARTQVGNLAHALKTPLSVLSNEASGIPGEAGRSVGTQTAAMRQQIDYYLNRARVAGATHVIGASHPIDETLEALTRTLVRINRDKAMTIDRTGETGVLFRGEAQDFEEIAGNLLENAFKWAGGRIRVAVETGVETPLHRPGFVLAISDDGPGIAAEQRADALKRGQRFDEQTPGSGLGLSIVADLVDMYGGTVDLGQSEEGGLSVRIVLPRAGAR